MRQKPPTRRDGYVDYSQEDADNTGGRRDRKEENLARLGRRKRLVRFHPEYDGKAKETNDIGLN